MTDFRRSSRPTARNSIATSPAGPFYGYNRPGAKPSEAIIQNWWRQGMMGGAKAHYDGIVAFSQTDFTEDLKKITVPVLVMHGDDDQIVPYEELRAVVGEAAEERHAENLQGLSARHADHGGRHHQRRPARVHQGMSGVHPEGMSGARPDMKVILFGATGMVGQGVLRECLLDAGVTEVLAVGRSPTGTQHAKLHEILHDNFTDFSAIESQLTGYDACFFCLGVSSIGMDAERYRHQTYDVTMAAAKTLARLNPGMVFTYVTGKGTDSTEQGPLRWARVKGKTENDLLKLPFKAAYMFRPSGIQPLHGVRSKTAWINAVYAVTAPLLSWMVRATPNHMTTSEQLGRAMIKVARDGYPKPILESADINAV